MTLPDPNSVNFTVVDAAYATLGDAQAGYQTSMGHRDDAWDALKAAEAAYEAANLAAEAALDDYNTAAAEYCVAFEGVGGTPPTPATPAFRKRTT